MRREILIDSAPGEVRVALLEDDLLSEILIERSATRGVSGNVYKGRVSNVLPGMQSAFLDIGLERDVFLFVEDVAPDGGAIEGLFTDEAGEAPERPPAQPRAAIEDLLAPGQEIVVQVAKEPLARKGARVTAHLTLPGRYLVYLPGVRHVGVSRRIEDPGERDRLKSLVTGIAGAAGAAGGFIVRTAGEGREARAFESDARHLVDLWNAIRQRAEARVAPALLHEELGAVARALRDLLDDDVLEVRVETEDLFRDAVEYLGRAEPDLVPKIRLHEGPEPLFEGRGVPSQIERALRPRVWLKSGGSIVINPTEALVAIDVNTGKYVGRRRLEETILKTNLEAAREIVRQVRLRDLAGIIVVDFIDMEEAASREELIQALQRELRRDRAKSRMLQISEFGLVEITRQRTRPSLDRTLCAPCPACGGAGRVKSASTVYFEILREARRVRAGLADGPILVRVHPDLAAPLEERRPDLAAALGLEDPGRIELQPDASLRLGQWTVVRGA